jgi:hypothetical protein
VKRVLNETEAEGREEVLMRRMLRVCAVVVLVLLAFVSWYMAGFFARYNIPGIGDERHFGLWSNVSTGLMYVFGTAAVWVAVKKRTEEKKR